MAACFAATFGITAAGAVLFGPQTMGWTVISLGVLAFVAAVVLERIAPMSKDDDNDDEQSGAVVEVYRGP